MPQLTIAEAVSRLRLKAGESQQVFATRLHISIKSLTLYETGKSQPRAKALTMFVREALRLDRHDLADYFIRRCEEDTGLTGLRELMTKSAGRRKNGSEVQFRGRTE